MEENMPPPQPAPPPQRVEKWPTIIGIIALVFGILGILGGLVAIANPFLIGVQMENAVQTGVADQAAVDAYMAEFGKLQWLIVPATLILGALLTLGGIFLLRRKPSGPLLLKIWSILKIVVGGFLIYKGAELSTDQVEILVGGGAAGTDQAEMAGNIASIVTKATIVFQSIWLVLLPIFLLIWFSRSKVKETVAKW